MTKPSLPKKGMSPQSVLEQLEGRRGQDVDWKGGKTFSLVYYAGEQVMQLLHDAYSMFMAENGLSPMAFPSLKEMENEVVAMTADMLHGGDAAAGSMTSGGTESIFMAMKTAREWSRKNRPHVAKPKIVAPVNQHFRHITGKQIADYPCCNAVFLVYAAAVGSFKRGNLRSTPLSNEVMNFINKFGFGYIEADGADNKSDPRRLD